MKQKNTQQPNKEQLAAITYGEGPLLIIAGAGTGKTSVITNRIAHLILDGGIDPQQILALTFTDKAAQEMEERVDRLLPYGYVDLWISTFHAFCERILRQYGLDIGLATDFRLINQTEQWLLVRQNFELFDLEYYKPKGNPTKFIHALLGHFSKAKDEVVYPETYMQYAESLVHSKKQKDVSPEEVAEAHRIAEVARAYSTYQQLLLDNNYLDFGDLINYTLELLKTRPTIRQKLNEQFRYILVDEFQDTNYAQYELLKILAGTRANITVVGDDDQSIYKFRGASISNILQFHKDFPKAARVVLTDNYRSRQEILDAAYQFIQYNNPDRLEVQASTQERIDKRLKAVQGYGGIVQHLHFQRIDDEVEGIAQHILALKKNNPSLPWSSIALLVRSNEAATYFTNFFKKINIPHHFHALRGLYNKPIIIDVISYLKLLDNYHEGPAMYRVLTSSLVNMDQHDVVKIVNYAKKKSLSIYEALRRITEVIPSVSADGHSKTQRLLALIDRHTEKAKTKSVVEIFLSFMQDSGILQKLLKEESLEDKLDMDYLQALFNRMKAFEQSNNEPTLAEFMRIFTLELESGDVGSLIKDMDGPDAVQIMTIHSSKGLEFEYVIIPNMVDKRFPTIERKDPIELPEALIKETLPTGNAHLQEERRLLYVALTRARTAVFLTSAIDYGGSRPKKLSQFIYELHEAYPSFVLAEPQVLSTTLAPQTISEQIVVEEFVPTIPDHFSFSQLAAFKKCPYQYKLGFIYKIPSFGKPVFSYGRTLHKTLEDFYKALAQKMTLGQTDLLSAINNISGKQTIGELLSLEDLYAIFEHSWIEDWYDSKEQQEEHKARGRATLKVFYESIRDQEPMIAYLEKKFNLKIKGANGAQYTLRGVIDRIDRLPNGKWHIIDYKTGASKKTLDWEAKMQLLIYQIAACELFNAEVEKLTYYYLDDNIETSFIGGEEEIDKLKKELRTTIENIKTSDFAANPDWHCQFCDFKEICEYKIL